MNYLCQSLCKREVRGDLEIPALNPPKKIPD
jgi:hypothetical protein